MLLSSHEVRSEGRTISGTVVQWGDVSPSHHERFEPGSLEPKPDAWLTWKHDRSRVLAWGDGLRFQEDEQGYHVEATLPPIPLADLALEEVRSGRMTGLSVDMRVRRDRREHGIRVIETAKLNGVGIVEHPSYRASRISEVRERNRTQIRGKVALGQPLPCLCRTGCDKIIIQPGAMDAAIEEAKSGAREIFAFMSGKFDQPVASVRGGSLGIEIDKDTLDVTVDGLPVIEAVEQFLSDAYEYFISIRPYAPDSTSTFKKEGTTAIFTYMDVRAIEIARITGPTAGLSQIEITEERSRRARRVWL